MTTQKDIRSLQLRLAGIAEELRELEEIVEAGEPGPEGPAGPQGPAGPTGDDGEGVPTGGTAGQVLAKIDGTDYNTEWVTTSGGGGTLGDLAALDTVGTAEIDNGAVTATKVGAGAVTSWQLDSNYEKRLVYKLEPVEPFMPWVGEVVGTYSNRRTYNPLELDRFLGRGSELVMDLDGTPLNESQKRNLTNQSYGHAVTIAAAGGNTGVLTIDMQTNGMVTSNGFTYAQGLLMLTFYSGWGPVSMSARTKDRDGNWTTRVCTPHMTSSNTPGAAEAVYWEVSLSGNHIVEIEITMTSQSDQQCGLGNISYIGTRMTMPEGPIINTLGGTFFGTVSGKEAGVENWFITADGVANFEDDIKHQGRPVLPKNQFYDSTGGYIYTVYGVNSNWKATRADSNGMRSSAIQTSNLPTALSNVSGLAYS